MTCKFYDPRPQQSSHTSTDEVSSFLAKLKATAPSCSFIHVPSISNAQMPQMPTSQTLPPIPRSSIEKVKYMLKNQPQPPSVQTIVQHGQELCNKLTIMDIAAIERATVGQSSRRRWHEERYGRLTASNFGKVCKATWPPNFCTLLLQHSYNGVKTMRVMEGSITYQNWTLDIFSTRLWYIYPFYKWMHCCFT